MLLAATMTATKAYLIGAAVVVVLLLLTEALARLVHARFFSTVIMGRDNRTSTSKTFVFMWTLLVGWALITLVIVGELVHTHACVDPNHLSASVKACTKVNDDVGLLQVGWHQFISAPLSNAYLVLLGIPAASAVAAKAVTQSKQDAQTLVKTTAPSGQSAGDRIAQIFSADDQTTDIGDFQFVIFNLITAAYFISEFVHPKGVGLPVIPDTLLGLTSVSAALYVGKKAATRAAKPAISSVFPTMLRVGQQFTVVGSNLTSDPTGAPVAGLVPPQVTVNGKPATNVTPDPNVVDRLTATVAVGTLAPGAAVPAACTVEVFSAYGATTAGYGVHLIR
jgi:hypothetical protein